MKSGNLSCILNTVIGGLLDTSSRIAVQSANRSTMNATTKTVSSSSTFLLDEHAGSDILSFGPRNTSQLTVPMELGESSIIHWPLPSNSNVAFGAHEHPSSLDILSFGPSNNPQLSAQMESQESPIIHWPLPSSNSNFPGGPGSTSSDLPSSHLSSLPSTVPIWCSLSGAVVSGQANAVAALRNENAESEPLFIAPRSKNLHTDGQQSQLESVSLNVGKIPLNIILLNKLCY